MRALAWAATLACIILAFASAHRRQTADTLGARPADTEQAQRDLQRLVKGPRPIGSEAARTARGELLDILRAAGLEPWVEQRFVCTAHGACGDAVNVLAKVAGDPARAPLVLSAHLDTVQSSPGAHDNALGVAVLVQVARRLQAGSYQGYYEQRPVIFVFDDGEEVGLLGAQAFVEAHPDWAKGAFQFITVDGVAGPSVFRIKGPADMAQLWSLAKAPRPYISSLEQVWPDTGGFDDTNIFSALGVPSVTVAGAQGYELYHTAADDLGSLSPETIADRTETTWRIVQAGFRDRHRHVSDGAYGEVFGALALTGTGSTWLLAALGALLLITSLQLTLRTEPLSAVLTLGLGLTLVLGLRFALTAALGPVSAQWGLLSTCALFVGASSLLARAGLPVGFIGSGMALLGLGAVALIAALFMPEAAFSLVVAAGCAGLVAVFGRAIASIRPLAAEASVWPQGPALLAGALILADQAAAMQAHLPESSGLVGLAFSVGPGLLCVALLAPLLLGVVRNMSLSVTVGALLLGLLAHGFAPGAQPVRTSSLRLIDEGPEARRLIVYGELVSGYTPGLAFKAQSRAYPWSSGNYPVQQAQVSVSAGPGPQVTTSSTAQGNLRIRVEAPKGSAEVRLSVAPGSGVGEIWVQGVRVPLPAEFSEWNQGWRPLTVHGGAREVTFELQRTAPSLPIRLSISTLSPGLPKALWGLVKARPPEVRAAHFGDSTERRIELVIPPDQTGLTE